jgi:hypothetical protein
VCSHIPQLSTSRCCIGLPSCTVATIYSSRWLHTIAQASGFGTGVTATSSVSTALAARSRPQHLSTTLMAHTALARGSWKLAPTSFALCCTVPVGQTLISTQLAAQALKGIRATTLPLGNKLFWVFLARHLVLLVSLGVRSSIGVLGPLQVCRSRSLCSAAGITFNAPSDRASRCSSFYSKMPSQW